MSEAPEPAPVVTWVRRDFGGKPRRFELRIGEIRELEAERKAGVGAILSRLAYNQFFADDIRETVRLGLMGGGADEAEAHRLVIFYLEKRPLGENLQLAFDTLHAALNGVPE